MLSLKFVGIQGRAFSLVFHNFGSRFGENKTHINLKQTAGKAFGNKDVLCYFVLVSERPDAMLPVCVMFNLVFVVEWLGLIKVYLYIESQGSQRGGRREQAPPAFHFGGARGAKVAF